MQTQTGTRRVIIENVQPSVEGGRYPAKRAVGEPFTVTADIFGDGHDLIRANLRFREPGQEWQEVPMEAKGNDRWEATFVPNKVGTYVYYVRAWVDHFATWRYGLRKKFDAGQQLDVEMKIGAEMLEKAADRSDNGQGERLGQWAQALRDADNPEGVVPLALSDEVAGAMFSFFEDGLESETEPLRVEAERKRALFSTWYEFFPRSASPEEGRHGTFKDCERVLPEVADMGFDVVYFPPIHPIGEKNRKGKNNAVTAEDGDPGSCWAIGSHLGGHKAIHPELGTLEDFKSLLAKAGELGLEVALDIAYQCAPDHPWVEEHPQWFRWRPDGTVQYAENPPKKYQDILPINFETEDWENLWQELKSVVEYWIEQGVRIFRVDNPHTKAFGFWEWMIAEVRAQYPEVIFLAEAFTRPRVMERLAKAGFNQSYTYFTWRNSPHEMREYLEELTKTEMREYFRPNFWPNTPDILPPVLTHYGEPAFIGRLILAATLSSNYGLYGPVYELGLREPHPAREEYINSEKYEIYHWDFSQYTRIKDFMKRINHIRKENPALQQTANVHFADAENPHLLCYGKYDPATGNRLIVAVNMDFENRQDGWLKLPLAALGLNEGVPFRVEDLLGGGQYEWSGEWNYVALDPHQLPAHVFRVTQ